MQQPNVFIVGVGDFVQHFLMLALCSPFHIGLPRTKPYLTNQNILYRTRYASVYKFDFIRSSCLWCFQYCRPFCVPVTGHFDCILRPTRQYPYLTTSSSPTPDLHFSITL